MKFRSTPLYGSRRSPVLAENVVATSQPLAAQAGLSMIAQGGNAADAALAAAIALTVVEPTGNGVGSDSFAILWDGVALHGLNASGRAPAAWSPERFAGREAMPERGWDSVTVPGAVSSWQAISDRFGKLPFDSLFQPAIRLAERGFAVSPIIAALWARGAETLDGQPGFRDHFLPNGRAPRAGDRFVNEPLARTLRLIAQDGAAAFYRGELAERLVAAAAQHGAAITEEDLARHSHDWCGTISQGFDDVTLHEIPPNGQGIAALMALGILDHTDIRDQDPDSAEALHLMWEAMKLSFRDMHAFVGDADAMRGVMPSALMAPDYLAQRAAQIDPARAGDFSSGAPKHGGTVYVTAADADGMMVSFIQSNYAGFGSGVVVPGTGIHLQNRAFGFALAEGHPNRVAGGKRPFHTIIPGFVMENDRPLMSFGVMGGPIQAQGHLAMTLRTQLWGQDVQTAIDAPRWRVTRDRGVACETSMDSGTVETLRLMGHDITLETPDSAFGFGGAQLIHRLESGAYAGGSDPRKDGCAVGF